MSDYKVIAAVTLTEQQFARKGAGMLGIFVQHFARHDRARRPWGFITSRWAPPGKSRASAGIPGCSAARSIRLMLSLQ